MRRCSTTGLRQGPCVSGYGPRGGLRVEGHPLRPLDTIDEQLQEASVDVTAT